MSYDPHPPTAGTTPDEVERLLAELLGLPEPEREAALDERCSGRPELREEVRSLLGCARPAAAFFRRLEEELSSAVPGDAAAGSGEPAPGSRVGRYRVVAPLGAGGMGTVYRARDEQLDRDVALKIVPPRLAAIPAVRARFLREARAVASLDHPNVCAVHEIGETSDGRPWMAMACYEGETLRKRLERGPLAGEEARRLGLALARGLGAAHARGIVHRDVKPGNVMLTTDGAVKLLDFGIARVADLTVTGPGESPGTPAYMAPEQVAGRPVDGRADLWGVGVVLYEALTGRKPFGGGPPEVVVREILEGEPPLLETLRPDLEPGLVEVVDRLLRKAPEERFPDASALETALEDREGRAAGSAPDTGRRSGRPGATTLAVAGLVALLLALAATTAFRGGDRWAPELSAERVAVLPFRVTGPDGSLAHLEEGMVDLLSMTLAGTDLDPVDPREVMARWPSDPAEGREPTLDASLDVAARTGAGLAVTGEVVDAGSRIVLSAALHDLIRGASGPAVQVEGARDRLPEMAEELAARLLGLGAEETRLASVTSSLPALQAYLEGRRLYRRSQFTAATHRFVRAVELDTTFASASLMAWRAAVRGELGTAPERNVLALAWRHRDRLAEADRAYLEALLGPGYPDGDWSSVERFAAFQRLALRWPRDAEIWLRIGEMSPHVLSRQGVPPREAMERTAHAFRTAVEVDSTFLPALTQLHITLAIQGDTAGAFDVLRRYLDREPAGDGWDTVPCATLAGVEGLDPARVRPPESLEVWPQVSCLFWLHHFQSHASAARDQMAEILARRGPEPEVVAQAAPMMADIALDRGRPVEARRYLAWWIQGGHVSPLNAAGLTIRRALHWDGLREPAEEAASDLEAWWARGAAEGEPEARSEALCALGQWRIHVGRVAESAPVVGKLREMAHESSPAGPRSRACAALLEAWASFLLDRPELDARVRALETLLAESVGDTPTKRESSFLLARIHVARGDPGRALDALHRTFVVRPFTYQSTWYRETGRVALLAGDSAAARDVLRRYLAFRTDPEPRLEEEVRGVRSELAQLGG